MNLSRVTIGCVIAFGLASCNSNNRNAEAVDFSVIDSSDSSIVVADVIVETQSDSIEVSESQKSTENNNQLEDGLSLEIRTFRNEGMEDYGYDIFMNGKLYVHQPNIPALQGASGFKDEATARKVAELVAGKIRMNILPPSVDEKELKALGVE